MALTSDQITAQNFKDFYDAIRPYLNGGNANTFAIATSAWVANTGSDAAAFPYVAEITTALYSSNFQPAEIVLLGTDITDYPTSTEEDAIALVDKYVKFTGSAIRLRATDDPGVALNLVVRG